MSRNCCCCSCSPQPSTLTATGSAPDRPRVLAARRRHRTVFGRAAAAGGGAAGADLPAARARARDSRHRAGGGAAARRRLNFLLPLLNGDTFRWRWAASLGGRLLVLWMVAILVRCVAVAFAPPTSRVWLRARSAAACCWPRRSGCRTAWRPTSRGGATGRPRSTSPEGLSAGSEAVLATQNLLLDHALSNLEDERPGASDLYFVGFAPYGRQDVFRKDVEAAQRRDGRALGHVGPFDRAQSTTRRRCSATPFATITNLRETLNEIGAAIDAGGRRRDGLPREPRQPRFPLERRPAAAVAGGTDAARLAGSCSTTPASSGGSSSCPRAIRAATSSRCRTSTR